MLLLFMPAAYGAVEAWSELVTLVAAALLSGCLLLRLFCDHGFRPIRSWLYLPPAMFLLLVAGQLVSLPMSLIQWIAPTTASLKQELLASSALPVDRLTISFYPLATAHGLRLFLVATTVLVVTANMFRRSRDIERLLLAIFVIGCAEALLALTQIATGATMIYWSVPAGQATSGSFVNYSNFSQFMNLSLGAGIALLVVGFDQDRRAEDRHGEWYPRITWERHGWILAGIVLCAISILASRSRNGAFSLLIAAAVVATALYHRGSLSWRGWLMGTAPLGVLTIVLFFGFDATFQRLSTLQQVNEYEGRWEMTLGTLRTWWAFPLFGTGLGTHEYIFPLFDTAVTPVVAGHADNDFAQLLEETGLIGGTIFLLFAIGMVRLLTQLIFRGHTSLAYAAYGMTFGLIAVAVHSATDFGQRLPANACLTAAFCGLTLAIAAKEPCNRNANNGLTHPRFFAVTRKPMSVLAGSLLLPFVGVWSWALLTGYQAYLGERWWAAAAELESQLQAAPNSATDQDYVDLISAATGAAESQPTNVKYGYWLNTYRWASIDRTLFGQSDAAAVPRQALPFAKKIADELAAVRSDCPTYGPPYALEGELRLFVLQDPRGEELIRQAVRLSSYDPPTCLVGGQIAARNRQIAEATALMNRAVELQPSYFSEVIGIYLDELKRLDLAEALAGQDYQRMQTLAAACDASTEFAPDAPRISANAVQVLRDRVTRLQAPATELADLARIDFAAGNFDSAIGLYRQALSFVYKQIDWRLNLARALIQAQRPEEALREVRICLRIRPQYPPAQQLLEELAIYGK